MTTSKLIQAIEVECVRQHVDEARRGYLHTGWALAHAWALEGRALTRELLLNLAEVIEPDNGGVLRKTPVTFPNGGYAVPGGQVEYVMEAILEAWTLQEDVEYRLHWLKEFLICHPFTDGNGRTGWVLQQWLMNTWADPQPLHDFHF